jgi:hypothetical protein
MGQSEAPDKGIGVVRPHPHANRRQTVGLAAVTTAVALAVAGIAWVAGRDSGAPVPASPIVEPNDPLVAARDPVAASTDPVDAATDPVTSPTEPVVTPSEEPVVRPKDTGSVPTTTQRVYLVAQPSDPCEEVGEMFAPLAVAGPGYTTTVAPTRGCREVEMGGIWVTYFVYDVPMPSEGTVRVKAGDQPTAELDAAKVATKRGIWHGTHGVTVVYTQKDLGPPGSSGDQPGVYEVSFIWRGNALLEEAG